MNELPFRSVCSSISGITITARSSTVLRPFKFTNITRHVLHRRPDALAVISPCLKRTYHQERDLHLPDGRTTFVDSTVSSFAKSSLRQLSTRHLASSSIRPSRSLHRLIHKSSLAFFGTRRRYLHGTNAFRKDTIPPNIPDENGGRRGDMGLPNESNSLGAKDEVPSSLNGATSNKNLMDRLPQIPHRPSREELLAAATGFWSRLKVRFKWFSIRSARPFNADEIGAFFSWVVLGHVLWIILGTTTFFSLAIFALNTVFAQETLARWVGNYLTRSSGIKVVFESAIVPKWGDGVITFKNVFVSRRPGHGKGQVSKGSPTTEAAVAAAAMRATTDSDDPEEDSNYTQFDVSLDTVNVTLSFNKWFNSKGLLRDVEVRGVRGVIDRTSVHNVGADVDPRSYKHEHNPGDFEIDSFKMSDLLVTVHQPNNFRPFEVSVFNCDLPLLRRQWLFYDFLSANQMSGQIDDSMFNLHPRQGHSFVGGSSSGESEAYGADGSPWKKSSRLRIDALNIDHLNRGVEGPFGWIRQGHVDIVADILFPVDSDESLGKLMFDFYDRMEATVTSSKIFQAQGNSRIPEEDSQWIKVNDTAIPQAESHDDDKRCLVMDLRLHLNDVRAAVPLFTKDLSYVNNALVRPIVAYMNSRHTFIPIHCRVIKRVTEFDGSWTIFDSGLMDDMSAEVSALAHDRLPEN